MLEPEKNPSPSEDNNSDLPRAIGAKEMGPSMAFSEFPENTFRESRVPESSSQLVNDIIENPERFGSAGIHRAREFLTSELKQTPGGAILQKKIFSEQLPGQSYESIFIVSVTRCIYDPKVINTLSLELAAIRLVEPRRIDAKSIHKLPTDTILLKPGDAVTVSTALLKSQYIRFGKDLDCFGDLVTISKGCHAIDPAWSTYVFQKKGEDRTVPFITSKIKKGADTPIEYKMNMRDASAPTLRANCRAEGRFLRGTEELIITNTGESDIVFRFDSVQWLLKKAALLGY